jgi:hypothetical protein
MHSITSLSASTADTGYTPPESALPRSTMSGRMPAWSMASILWVGLVEFWKRREKKGKEEEEGQGIEGTVGGKRQQARRRAARAPLASQYGAFESVVRVVHKKRGQARK